MKGSIQDSSFCEVGEFPLAMALNLTVSVVIYLLIKKTDNWSWMDRLWSILPMVHALHLLLYPHYCEGEPITHRKLMMVGLILLWGLRLTHALWRKGVYSPGKEDPRLTEVKNTSSPLKKELFVIFFICLYQPMLALWLVSPVSYTTSSSINPQDLVLLIFGLEFIILQGIADNQMNTYQVQKKKFANFNQENIPQLYKIGFPTKGLWGYSRHPNYFGEVCFWWVIFLYSFIDYGISIAGLAVLQYSIFFITSIKSGETLTLRKYPIYKLYQQHVSSFIPLPNRFHDALERELKQQ